jgi:site-specific DNA recombinase
MVIVIYARQSLDRDGQGSAVERQLDECRALAARLNLTVGAEYVDNDTSATSGKARPRFEAMLDSHPETIIAWHQDRLLRLTRDLERVISLNVPVFTVTAGTLDLTTPAGRAVARTVAAWSQYEGEQKATRQKAANAQRAAQGKWQFSNRPYGYQRVDGAVRVVEAEAAVLRDAYNRYIAGETYYSIVADLNTRSIPTLNGGAWTMPQLRDRLKNPGYAGIRMYQGEAVADGDWEPVISRETWDEYQRARTSRKRPHTWSNRTKHLLSGLALCGVCGAAMLARPEYSKPAADGTKRVTMTYQCTASWCVSRNLPRVDAVVEAAIIDRLSQPDARDLLTPREDVQPLVAASDQLRQRKDELAALFAEGHISSQALREQSTNLQRQLDDYDRRTREAQGSSELSALLLSADIAEHWRNVMTLPQRRMLISALMTITIRKQQNTRRFDPADIDIQWN